MPTEVDRHDITLILHALRYERLLPGDIMDTAIDDTRVKTRGEHDNVVVALESRLYGVSKLLTIASGLVDTHTDGPQPREEHQQVVDEIAELPVIMAPNDRTKTDTVDRRGDGC